METIDCAVPNNLVLSDNNIETLRTLDVSSLRGLNVNNLTLRALESSPNNIVLTDLENNPLTCTGNTIRTLENVPNLVLRGLECTTNIKGSETSINIPLKVLETCPNLVQNGIESSIQLKIVENGSNLSTIRGLESNIPLKILRSSEINVNSLEIDSQSDLESNIVVQNIEPSITLQNLESNTYDDNALSDNTVRSDVGSINEERNDKEASNDSSHTKIIEENQDDISAFVDVVTTFKCRKCNHSATSRQHLLDHISSEHLVAKVQDINLAMLMSHSVSKKKKKLWLPANYTAACLFFIFLVAVMLFSFLLFIHIQICSANLQCQFIL